MRFSGRNIFWRRLPRRVCVGVALVAYLIAAVGFPVPAASRDLAGAPAPSQARPCGCPITEPSRHCCCSAGGGGKATREPCCSGSKRPPVPNFAKGEPAPFGDLRWVSGVAALACRGHATVWVSSGAVTPPPAPLAWEPHTAPTDWLPSSSENPSCLSLVPPDPPPRPTHS
ncbi:MAG TPA: hypothetical protein VKA46_37800 [Gemmataceae bacterium]|nr:hypothetical protein [Gemmataceae bacterium]